MDRLTRLLLLLCLLLAAPIYVTAQTTSTIRFEEGKSAFAAGDYLLALSNFQAARDAGLDGPAIYYNLAVCHFKLGDYQAAESDFQIIVDDYPAMRSLAEYNLGLISMRQNRRDEARTHFERARLDSLDEKIVQLADRMLDRLDPVPEPGRWFSLLNANLGHDDNVSLVADAGLPSGQSGVSNFTEVFGVVSGPLSSSPRFRIDGSLYSVRYGDIQGFDQNAIRFGVVYQRSVGHWQTELGPYLTHSTLDGNGFEQRAGVGLTLTRTINDRMSFTARYEHDEIDEIDSRFSFISGSRDRLRLLLQNRSSDIRTAFGYVLEGNDRQDPNVSPSRNRFFARVGYSITSRWIVDVEASVRSSNFDELSEQRDEDLTEIAVGVSRTFQNGWRISMAFRSSENDSNDPIFAYDRTRTSLGVNKAF